MNVNSRVNWHAGMELTEQTFKELENSIARKEHITNKISARAQFGIIPDTPFMCSGMFVRKTIEISPLRVMALMPSGEVLHIDENVVVEIPMLYGDEYFLGYNHGDGERYFDKEGIPFVYRETKAGIYTLAELKENGALPLMKFTVSDGKFTIDQSYVPPCISLQSHHALVALPAEFAQLVDMLAGHEHLELGEAQRTMRHYGFALRGINSNSRLQDLIELLQEIARSVEYYIMQPNLTEVPAIEEYSMYDTIKWCNWLRGYLSGAITVLDKVELQDHSIDYDKLKEQVKDELYQQLYPQLRSLLEEDMYNELQSKLRQELMDSLTTYLNNDVKTCVEATLHQQLSDQLTESLSASLYQRLYDALYRPVVKEEDTFMPQI